MDIWRKYANHWLGRRPDGKSFPLPGLQPVPPANTLEADTPFTAAPRFDDFACDVYAGGAWRGFPFQVL
jgi:hypothetical protein